MSEAAGPGRVITVRVGEATIAGIVSVAAAAAWLMPPAEGEA